MMDRRAFIGTLAGGLLAAPLAAEGQQAGKVWRIGVLSDASPLSSDGRVQAVGFAGVFQSSLRDLGYVEGRNLAIEWRNSEGRSDRLDDLAAELVRLMVDVVVATYPAAVFSAKKATTTIPIVMVHTPDPVQLGLVASLAHPGGNITGVTSLSVDLSAKHLELLKQLLPRVSRIAVLWNRDNPWHPVAVKGLEDSARSSGVQLQSLQVQSPEGFRSAFSAMAKERAQAVLFLADPLTFIHRAQLADLAVKQRLPSMGGPSEWAGAGCLMSYWADTTDLYRRAASYADRILRGANPGDLPIEQPTKFELVINLRTAKALGLTIPPSLLQRADQVIE
jgi:ABC-type uncharacterized transport system substrate-binding protein